MDVGIRDFDVILLRGLQEQRAVQESPDQGRCEVVHADLPAGRPVPREFLKVAFCQHLIVDLDDNAIKRARL